MSWWDSKAGKIGKRDWDDIREKWIRWLPTQINPPSHAIAELANLELAVSGMSVHNNRKVDEVDGLREAMFLEGVFLLRKAANALAGAQVHIGAGLCSWSLSGAYHAAFFAMKSVQHFLGFAVPDLNGSGHLVDVWPTPEDQSSNARRRGEQPEQKMLFVKLGQRRVEHQPMWAFFQRLLRITAIDAEIWPTAMVQRLTDFDCDDFARQRNRIHYRDTFWPFPDDLSDCVLRDGFGECAKGVSVFDALDLDNDSFSILLGFSLLWMSAQLLRDLAKYSKPVETVVDSLVCWLTAPHNSIYLTAFPA